MTDQYIPGVCNIGREEVKGRKKILAASVIVVITAAILYIRQTDSFLPKAFLFISFSTFVVLYLQVKRKFCVRFGMFGYFNFGKFGREQKITDKAYRRKDQLKTLQIILLAVIAAAVFMLAITFFSKLF